MAGRLGFLGRFWHSRFTWPAEMRAVFGHLADHRAERILQLGLPAVDRTVKLLKAAAGGDTARIHFVGLDLFESRGPDDPPGPTLKEAHRRLAGLGRVQLVPGVIDASLSRLCNHLGSFDLVLVSPGSTTSDRCWLFIQRLAHRQSAVFEQTATDGDGEAAWALVPAGVIDQRARRALGRRAA